MYIGIMGLAIFLIFIVLVILLFRARRTEFGYLDPMVTAFLKIGYLMPFVRSPEVDDYDLEQKREDNERINKLVGFSFYNDLNIQDIKVRCKKHDLNIRLYRKKHATNQKSNNLLIYLHGGGFCLGSLDSHNSICSILARDFKGTVAAVDYPLSPEEPFPTALEELYALLLHVESGVISELGRPDKICISGDSAGGNLAAALCLLARDRKGPVISHQTLIYPVTDLSGFDRESYKRFGHGYMLEQNEMEVFARLYCKSDDHRFNMLVSPLVADSLAKLPPAYIITAEFDPLRDEGELYYKRLLDYNVEAEYYEAKGMIHAFLNATALLPHARMVIKSIAEKINAYL